MKFHCFCRDTKSYAKACYSLLLMLVSVSKGIMGNWLPTKNVVNFTGDCFKLRRFLYDLRFMMLICHLRCIFDNLI